MMIAGLTISTHTPLARRDPFSAPYERFTALISTHTPLARRDHDTTKEVNDRRRFQLTRLLRGVTITKHEPPLPKGDFNSHASCEA